MKTKQLHVMIEETTYQELRRLAFTRGISLGALVRQALALLRTPQATAAPLPEKVFTEAEVRRKLQQAIAELSTMPDGLHEDLLEYHFTSLFGIHICPDGKHNQ
jgi:hypothetical protein